jgi:hypothetical protein
MTPLREVVKFRKAKRGWLMLLECTHQVRRRRVPFRARCSECEKTSYNGPLFTWQERRDTVAAWPLVDLAPPTSSARAAG